MRSLFKLSLAALLALFVAGTAFAADVKWSGNIGAGFGQVSYGAPSDDVDGYSEYITSYEANIRATVAAGPVTAIWRLRSRGHQSATTGQTEAGVGAVKSSGSSTSTCTLDDGITVDSVDDTCEVATTTTVSGPVALSYAEIWYKPTDTFTVGFGRFQGQAWSQPMSGTYLILNVIGAPEYFMNWTGIDGLDLENNAGVVQVGLAIASECRPSCTGGTKTTQSIVPHLTGKFGDIGLRVQVPSTSGVDAADESHTGTGYQVGVSWSGMQGVYVGFDLQSFTDKEVGGGDDQTTAGTGLRLDFSGIQLGYWSGSITNVGGGEDKSTETFIKLAYFLKVSDNASIVPEYTTGTKKANEDADAVTNSMIRLVGNVTF
jgi:hypothetical protein